MRDANDLFYRDASGQVRCVDRAGFRGLADKGEISAGTPVFDITVQDLRSLREEGIERPAAESWHGRAFAVGASVSA